MTIAELIEALDGLEPSRQLIIRDSDSDDVLHILGVYAAEPDGLVELELGRTRA